MDAGQSPWTLALSVTQSADDGLYVVYISAEPLPLPLYRVAQKNWHTLLYALTSYALTSSNIDRFSNLFHSLNQENICNNTLTEDHIAPQLCRYTTFWNVNS